MMAGVMRAISSPARLMACSVSAVMSGTSKLSSIRLPESFFSGRVRVRFCSLFSRITVTAAARLGDDRRACVKSEVSCTGWPLTLTTTSPAWNPAFSPRLPFSTERTSTPLPPLTPKNSPSCGVMFSTISPLCSPECTTTTETGRSKSGRVGICGGFGISGICHVIDLCRSASCTLMVMGWPSRLMPRFTTRPGGVSLIIRRNWAALSTAVPLRLTMTSCSCSPAFPAGAS